MDKYAVYCETHGRIELISDSEPILCPIDDVDELISTGIEESNIETNPDGILTKLSLDNYKALKNNAIDQRTAELIAMGHEFPPASGNIFSMSQNAQLNVLGLMQSKDVLTYPQPYATKDNTGQIILNNATDVSNFYYNVLGTKKTHLDSGNALIDQINSATDEAGVDAVIDNR